MTFKALPQGDWEAGPDLGYLESPKARSRETPAL